MLDSGLYALIVCPGCHAPLSRDGSELVCSKRGCSATPRRWPIVDGVPIIIDESRSIFRVTDLSAKPGQPKTIVRYLLSKVLHLRPRLSKNIAAHKNYRRLGALLHGTGEQGKVLVVGCGEGGIGLSEIRTAASPQMVFTDVRWTPIVSLLCDGHQLPFREAEFDGLIIQAVIEHVLDLQKVMSEVTRVLRVGGLIYVECPFLQPGHGGAYDFARLTQVGLRYALRDFLEIDSGISGGPGMAVALTLQAALRTVMPGLYWRYFADWITDWMFFWLKYLDPLLTLNEAATDVASGFYFIGRKHDMPVSNAVIMNSYRGPGTRFDG